MEKSNNKKPQPYVSNIKLPKLHDSQHLSPSFESKLGNKYVSIIKQGEKIHSKYLKLLSLYNLPPHLINEVIADKQQYQTNVEIQAQQKKDRKDVSLPLINIKPGQILSFPEPAREIISFINKFIPMLKKEAGNFKPSSNKKTNQIESQDSNQKELNEQQLNDIALFKQNYIDEQNIPIETETIKRKKQKKYKAVISSFHRNQLDYIIKTQSTFVKPVVKKAKPVYKPKPKPLLPWIAEGRKKHEKNKKLLLKYRAQLRYNKTKTLSRQQKKIIKQFRKSRKFGKYGRYGPLSKFTRKANAKAIAKANAKAKAEGKIKIVKRQFLYLQHKRLSSINNMAILPQRYMYMLIIIWYLSINLNLFLSRIMLKKEIWLNVFLRNLWIAQSQSQTNNFYLNYAINHGPHALITNTTLYNPSHNPLYYELQPLNNYQRLTINLFNKRQGLNKRNKHLFKPKRKSRVRTFFHLSAKLKNNGSGLLKRKFGKHIKKNKKKKLEDDEWLFVTKFTRRKYQYQFNAIFSQLKNIKKIHTYIQKPQPSWHQSYIIANPYYYTQRYKTFIYQMPYKSL